MRQIYAVCERKDIPVEINANGFGDNRAYPSKDALILSKEYKLRYIINSDAHRPEHLCGEVVNELEEFVKGLGISVLEFLPEVSQEA